VAVLRIDSHQHFWKYDPVRDAWITPDREAIRRDFLPDDLRPLLRDSNIDGSVNVQVDQSAKETLMMLRLADQNPFIKGVVGWVDLRSPGVNDQLAYLSQYKKLKGFRHIVQAEPDGFLLQKDFLRGIKSLADFGYTYDLLVYPTQLQEAVGFVRQFPAQKFVLDHMAKPLIREGSFEPWKKYIANLASAGNVYCKLSGMVTEADWKKWEPADFRPYLDVVFSCFGPQRLLYGSDWPVCLLASTYQQQLAIVEDYINPLSFSEKQHIMGENAVQFYNL
jgi:L-fuconolactonase